MPSSERAGVVVHPLRVDDVADLRDRVDKVFADAGWAAPEYRETTPEDPEALKLRLGALAYVISGIRHLRDEMFRVEVTVDGRTTRHRARTVLAGNVGSLQAGIALLPDARPDDGGRAVCWKCGPGERNERGAEQ
jgi:hypothetical protein